MNTHVQAILLNGPKVCVPASASMLPVGAANILPNQPAAFVEHNPTADMVYWLFEVVQTGSEIPPGATYCGTLTLLEKHTSLIKVPGSQGMTNQDGLKVNIVHVYCRLCPPEELPEELREKEPGH